MLGGEKTCVMAEKVAAVVERVLNCAVLGSDECPKTIWACSCDHEFVMERAAEANFWVRSQLDVVACVVEPCAVWELTAIQRFTRERLAGLVISHHCEVFVVAVWKNYFCANFNFHNVVRLSE